MHFVQRRIFLQRLLKRREVPIHQRAEGRQRTPRVDERHDDGRAFERGERSLASVLIDEGRPRDLLARAQQPEARRRARRRRLGGRLLERRLPHSLDLREMRAIREDDERRVDQIARCKIAERLCLLHFVRHRHRRHEAFDLLVLDDDEPVRGVDRLHLSLQRVTALVGSRTPAAEHGDGEAQRENDMRPHVW